MVVTGALLLPGGRAALAQNRRVAELRAAADGDGLVAAAYARAARDLHRPTPPRIPLARVVTVTGCVVAAGIHVAVCPEHLREGVRFAAFFAALSLAQLATAAVAGRRERLPIAALVAVNGGAAALWALTRTVSLPFGLAEREPVGVLDLVTVAIELVVVAAALGTALGTARATARAMKPALATERDPAHAGQRPVRVEA